MTEPNDAVPAATTATGGEAGAIGYEYQIAVTVWLALELMVQRRWCSYIEVEPASEEDVAARLEVPKDNVTVELGINAGTIDLDIQVKGRSTGQWTAATFRDVVNRAGTTPATAVVDKDNGESEKLTKRRGPSPRPSPLARLTEDSAKQYLFVTNADVDATLHPFVIRQVGERSTAQKEPWDTGPAVNANVAERLAIRPQINSEFLDLSIDRLLGSVGVPTQHRDECRKNLVEEVRARLLGNMAKTLSIETLRGIIQHHGGAAPQDSRIVRPKNFEQMQERLEQDRALLIAGPPGTGKTLVSHELARLFQQGDESHEIIHVSHGPAEIRQYWERVGNYLFIVEDPWGGYEVGDQADLWKKELPSLFAELPTQPGKRIIVTSRAGLLPKSGGGDLAHELKKAQVLLRSGDYSRLQRKEILHRTHRRSQPWQRNWLSGYEERILDALPEPMALSKLGRHVADASDARELDVEKLIKTCAQDALGSHFAEEIKGRGEDAVNSGIVLWAWHGIRGGLKEAAIPYLLSILRKGGLTDPPDVRKLLQWLEASEWWPRHGAGWRVHPTLLEGLDALARSEPGTTNRLLGALVAGLHRHGHTDQAIRFYLRVQSLLEDLDPDLKSELACFALDQFAGGDENEAAQAYYAARQFLQEQHPVAKLLTLLKPSVRSRMFARWAPPQVDAGTIAELSASPHAREAALRFVKFVIARDTLDGYSGIRLMQFLRIFGWDFSRECLTLALEQLGGFVENSCATLVEAGLSEDQPQYEAVFDASLDALAAMVSEDNVQSAVKRQADQFEVSPAGVEHWGDQRGDDYNRVISSLKAAMKPCRQLKGWQRLSTYPRAEELVSYWVELLEPGASTDEVEKIAAICGTKNRGTFWKAAVTSGRTEMVGSILNDLATAPPEMAKQCLDALKQLIDPNEHSRVLVPALKALPWPRRVQFAVSHSHHFGDATARPWWVDCFSEAENEAICCCDAVRDEKTLPLAVSDGAVECLEMLANAAGCEHSGCALLVLAKLGRANPVGASQLWQSPQWKDRQHALLAAISTGLPCVKEWLLAALTDSEARVRETAMRHMSNGADELLQDTLLNMMHDRSALVQKALAEVIGEQKWQRGVPALLHFLGDQLDFTDYNDQGAGPCFEVAREAAASLGKLKPLAKSTIDKVLDFLSQRPAKGSYQHDYKVHALLLEVIASEKDARVLPHLVATLADTWNVAAWRRSYYPLRSAAAWALCTHLEKQPDDCRCLTPSDIAVAANDFNSSLAGPALIVLGMLGQRATSELSALPSAPSFTRERCLLVWLFVPPEASRERDTLRAAIGARHPASELLALLEAENPMTKDAWAKFLSQHRASAQWFQSLENGDDVEPVLSVVLRGSISKTSMHKLLNTALTPDSSAMPHDSA
jgi:hypothetical protein